MSKRKGEGGPWWFKFDRSAEAFIKMCPPEDFKEIILICIGILKGDPEPDVKDLTEAQIVGLDFFRPYVDEAVQTYFKRINNLPSKQDPENSP